MPIDRLNAVLSRHLSELATRGTLKGAESVTTGVLPASGSRGPRYLLAGEGDTPFLRMNSNGYLGLALRAELIAAEEAAVRDLGTGPGAVRFIGGSFQPHVELERALAAFHGREAGMIFSSAYAAVLSVIVPLTDADTALISDELNHNCIINAARLARPQEKHVYRHLDLSDLEAKLQQAAGRARRALIVTDGIFSMRGVHAPLADIVALARRYDRHFAENVVVVVDDSHGVGALGATGRGSEEQTGSEPVDVLVATLGKALGVNGGYVVGDQLLIDYLRETSAMYIYSNPISPGEAAAARKALEILDSEVGRGLLAHLREVTDRFRRGLLELGYETLAGDHPVVPLMVRDTPRTAELTAYLRSRGILATGLKYPVVPEGDESIRFQISADHSGEDIDQVLEALADFRAGRTGRL